MAVGVSVLAVFGILDGKNDGGVDGIYVGSAVPKTIG